MSRQITAQLWRSTGPGKPRELLWTRYYAWMDTAVAKASSLALYYEVGAVVEFTSSDRGFHLGTLKILPKRKVELSYSALLDNSPALLKLLSSG